MMSDDRTTDQTRIVHIDGIGDFMSARTLPPYLSLSFTGSVQLQESRIGDTETHGRPKRNSILWALGIWMARMAVFFHRLRR